MSAPEVVFEEEITASSLKILLTSLSHAIGRTRKPRAARHFTATFESYPDDPSLVETSVGVPFAEPLQADDRLLTVLPAFDEDLAL